MSKSYTGGRDQKYYRIIPQCRLSSVFTTSDSYTIKKNVLSFSKAECTTLKKLTVILTWRLLYFLRGKSLFFNKIIIVCVCMFFKFYFGRIKSWQSYIGLYYYFEKSYWSIKSPKLETTAFRASRITASSMDRKGSLTEWDKLDRVLMVRLDADGHPILSLSISLLSWI